MILAPESWWSRLTIMTFYWVSVEPDHSAVGYHGNMQPELLYGWGTIWLVKTQRKMCTATLHHPTAVFWVLPGPQCTCGFLKEESKTHTGSLMQRPFLSSPALVTSQAVLHNQLMEEAKSQACTSIYNTQNPDSLWTALVPFNQGKGSLLSLLK